MKSGRGRKRKIHRPEIAEADKAEQAVYFAHGREVWAQPDLAMCHQALLDTVDRLTRRHVDNGMHEGAAREIAEEVSSGTLSDAADVMADKLKSRDSAFFRALAELIDQTEEGIPADALRYRLACLKRRLCEDPHGIAEIRDLVTCQRYPATDATIRAGCKELGIPVKRTAPGRKTN